MTKHVIRNSFLLLLLLGAVVRAEPAIDTPPAQTNEYAKFTVAGLSDAQISKKLSNPIAHLISLPMQYNWDTGGGPKDDGQHHYVEIKPIIPLPINDDWVVLSRTLMYLEHKHNFGYGSKSGLGDLTQTFFLSPVSKPGELRWGIGPEILMPTATDDHLGAGKWGAGPSVILVQELDQWTFGILASHTWSFAGDSHRDYVNSTLLQPFVVRHLPHAMSLTFMSEYTYDWHDNEELFPLNLTLGKVVRFGKLPVNFSLGGRYYLDKPSGGPDWGARFMVTFVLPGL